jgi:hypothetical protein
MCHIALEANRNYCVPEFITDCSQVILHLQRELKTLVTNLKYVLLRYEEMNCHVFELTNYKIQNASVNFDGRHFTILLKYETCKLLLKHFGDTC